MDIRDSFYILSEMEEGRLIEKMRKPLGAK
jgi:hypothetical protein